MIVSRIQFRTKGAFKRSDFEMTADQWEASYDKAVAALQAASESRPPLPVFDTLFSLLPASLQEEALAGLGQSVEVVLRALVAAKFTLETPRAQRIKPMTVDLFGRNVILHKLLDLARVSVRNSTKK